MQVEPKVPPGHSLSSRELFWGRAMGSQTVFKIPVNSGKNISKYFVKFRYLLMNIYVESKTNKQKNNLHNYQEISLKKYHMIYFLVVTFLDITSMAWCLKRYVAKIFFMRILCLLTWHCQEDQKTCMNWEYLKLVKTRAKCEQHHFIKRKMGRCEQAFTTVSGLQVECD